jgi:hypothetical protein
MKWVGCVSPFLISGTPMSIEEITGWNGVRFMRLVLGQFVRS